MSISVPAARILRNRIVRNTARVEHLGKELEVATDPGYIQILLSKLEKAQARLQESLAEGQAVLADETLPEPTGRTKGYTQDQLDCAFELRKSGKSWADIAEEVADTKAGYYFSKVVRQTFGSDPKPAEQAEQG